MMNGGQFGAVAQRPPLRGQVQGEQLLFAAEMKDVAESADGLERGLTNHGRTGQKTQDRRAGKTGMPAQRAAGQLRHQRIFPALRPDLRPCSQYGQFRVPVEDLRAQRGRTGVPPRVVVAERDVVGPTGRHADVAGHRAQVGAELEQCQSAAGPCGSASHGGYGSVVGTVVHHDDRAACGVEQPGDHRAQFFGPITAGDDERDLGGPEVGVLVGHNPANYPLRRGENAHA